MTTKKKIEEELHNNRDLWRSDKRLALEYVKQLKTGLDTVEGALLGNTDPFDPSHLSVYMGKQEQIEKCFRSMAEATHTISLLSYLLK